MAFSPDEIEQLAALIDSKVKAGIADVKADVSAVQAQPAVEDVEAAVEDYVHLADGNVVKMPQGEVGTHVDGVAVIGKYQVGA